MTLNWKSVTAHHVQLACAHVSSISPRGKSSGIIVWDGEKALPAKEVLRVAYRLANDLSESEELRFSSGDSSIAILQRLGFRAERRAVDKTQ